MLEANYPMQVLIEGLIKPSKVVKQVPRSFIGSRSKPKVRKTMFDKCVELSNKIALDLQPSLQKSDFKKQVYELIKSHYYTKCVCVSIILSIFFSLLPKEYFFPKIEFHFSPNLFLYAK
jgi:hypothetical protein